MRLMMPGQPVAYPCPLTGARMTGTIARMVVRNGSPVYVVAGAGGVEVEVAIEMVLPTSVPRPGFVPGDDPVEMQPAARTRIPVEHQLPTPLHELRNAGREMLIAVAVMAPVSVAYVATLFLC